MILTNISAAYYGLLARSFVGGGVKRAMMLGVLLDVTSQVVIFASAD